MQLLKLCLIVVMWQCLAVMPTLAERSTSISDSLELIRLYENTGGIAWDTATNWGFDAPLESWYGITTSWVVNGDDSLKVVAAIDLAANNLSDSIQALNLPHLVRLDLSGNALTGPIPTLDMPQLEELNLSSNDFVGIIPAFDFPLLRELNLSFNRLGSTIAGFSLPNLRTLLLIDNNLFGAIPVLDSPQLVEINLSFNSFSGTIPELAYPLLEVLDFSSNNRLEGPFPDFDLPRLKVLNLGYCGIEDTIPAWHFPELEVFDLQTNNLQRPLPQFDFPRLRVFSIGSNRNLGGTIPIFDFPELERFNMLDCGLQGAIPLFPYPKLQKLELQHNELQGEIPDFELPELVHLSIHNNNLSGAIPAFNMPWLNHINLISNNLSGEIPSFQLPSLVDLLLHDNRLSGIIPYFDMPRLQTLALSDNKLTGSVPNPDLPSSIASVNLSDNQLVFHHLEQYSESLRNFSYYDQDTTLPIRSAAIDGDTVLFVEGDSSPNNVYRWQRLAPGETEWKYIDSANPTGPEYSPEFDGRYRCEVSNTVLRSLLLYTVEVDMDNITVSVEDEPANPTAFTATLTPSPTAERGTLHISLVQSTPLRITLSDIAGRSVFNVVSDIRNAGTHAIPLDVAALPPGRYICSITTDRHTKTILVVIVR